MAPKRSRQDTDPEEAAKKPRRGFRVGPDNLPDGPWRRRNIKIKQQLIQKAKSKREFLKYQARAAREAQETATATTSSAATPTGLHPDRQFLVDQHAAATAANNNNTTTETTPSNPPPQEEIQPNPSPAAAAVSPPAAKQPNQNTPPPTAAEQNKEEDATLPKSAPPKPYRAPRRPGYYDKALEQGQRKKAEAEAREAERKRREEERARKQAERERMRKAMLKARGIKPGSGGGGRGGGGGRPFGGAGAAREGKRKLGRESHVLLDKVRRMVGDKA